MTTTETFTHSEVENAAEQLGLIVGLSRSEVMNYAYAAAKTRDTQDVAAQVGLMARRVFNDPQGFNLTAGQVSQLRVELSKHDTDDRRRLAERGMALPDGSYPIEDEEDAKNAADLIRSKHGDFQAAAKLLARRCAEEGWRNPLRDEGVILATWTTPFGLTAEEGAMVSMIEDTGDPVAAEVARICLTHSGQHGIGLASPLGSSPESFGLAQDHSLIAGGHGHGGADAIAARNPRMFGQGGNRTKPGGTTARHRPGRGHIKTCPKDCARDHNQPRRGNIPHPEAERLIAKHAGLGMFGKPDPDRTAGNRTY
jgi:hypothetical protein